jgi:hypothetical protein
MSPFRGTERRTSEEADLPVPVEPERRTSEEADLPVPVARFPARVGWVTGVRGRDSDAMMLRSAEADPHVIEHAFQRGPKLPPSSRETTRPAPVPKHPPRHGQSSLPEDWL